MGTNEPEHSQPPSTWPDEATDHRALPSFWPARKTEAVVSEALQPAWATGEVDDACERWYERATEEGVDEDLASLGRSLMREARAQRWDDDRMAECGWLDAGEAMLDLALTNPEHAQARWRALLDRA
jgi:hypothetical protein